MPTLNDVHQQFAEYFQERDLKPFLYLLSQKMSEGHICISEHDLKRDALPDAYQSLDLSMRKIEEHDLVSAGTAYTPFVINGDRFYLQRYFAYESRLLERIKVLAASSAISHTQRKAQVESLKGLILQLFSGNGSRQTDWQLVAAIVALMQDFAIITGGPGTGKTTTVAKILTLMFTLNPELKVALAAPTGKAAARMAESLMKTQNESSDEIRSRFSKLKPATIHRLLGWQQGTPYFRHNEANPLPYDLVIVDESSMIDVAMFAKLMQAVGKGTRIILLGDKDQLASVEAGSLFGDLCNALHPLNQFSDEWRSFINQFIEDDTAKIQVDDVSANQQHPLFQHIVELQYSHRFQGGSGIGRISKAIIRNDADELLAFIGQQQDKDVVIDTDYDETIFLDFIKGFESIFSENKFFDEKEIINSLNNLNNLRILCAVRDGDHGVYQLNSMVEAYLARKRGIQPKDAFYEYRPVMVTKNNYTLGLYNGDIGMLRKDNNGVMKAWFLQSNDDGSVSLKSVLPGFITHMETVYAMTIHKSQGSEFKKVLVVLPKQQTQNMLTRELVYTAVTRARESVIIQTSAEVLLEASGAHVQRGSGVIDRLKSE